jgi:ferredoxin
LNIKCKTKNGTIDVPFSKNTILESLEEQNVETNYHCRDGFCGACRCVLLTGKVEYKLDPLAYFDDNEILTCCTAPITDIEILIE